jgi:membrane protease YdiL (CAAX protease family)
MNSVLLYSLISFGFSWIIFLFIVLFNLSYQNPITVILLVIYMFGPFVASFVVTKIKKEKFTEKIGLNKKINRWFFVSWFIFVFIVIFTILISVLFPKISLSLKMEGFFEKYSNLLKDPSTMKMKEQMERMPLLFFFLSMIQGLFAGATINALAAFGEESGWRGFLLNEMKDKNFVDATFRIGLLWGAWHAPIIALGHNYPEHPKIGVFMMIIWCVLLTFIFNYLRIKSKNVLSSAVLHGTLNAVAGISIIYVKGGNDLTVGLTGVSGFLSLIFFIGLIFAYDVYISKEKIFLSKIGDKLN